MPLHVNVKRGMLRLWIVLSIAWAALSVPLTWDGLTQTRCARWEGSVKTWAEDPTDCSYLSIDELFPIAPTQPSAPQVDSRDRPGGPVTRDPWDPPEAPAPRGNPWDLPPGFVIVQPSAAAPVVFREIPYWSVVNRALIFIIAPPAVIFIAGIAAFWIFAGFREKPTR